MAFLTAIKMLPNHSNANVPTDSQVAIEVLKKSYRGDFQGFQEEFFGTIKDKHLNIHLVKVKGHEDPENIIVDKLAKEGAQGQNMIDITKLLSQNQKILINTNKKTIIFDYRKYIKDIQRKEYLDIFEDKSDLPFNQSQSLTHINLKYMDQRFDTETKLSIWRNMTDSHIRQFRQVYCDNCECEVDLERFIYYCEETECFRRYFLTKFTNLTGASSLIQNYKSIFTSINHNFEFQQKLKMKEDHQLLEIPTEIWQCCIFEYWLGPLHQIELNNHDQIMKFKKVVQPRMIERLDLSTVRTIQKFCCAVSKKFKALFVVEMNEFWRRVSNVLEMVVYWQRFASSEGLSLAKGDISVGESIGYVKMQKLIETTEMNCNREYADIIDTSECIDSWGGANVDITEIENEFDTHEVNQQFERRIQQLMFSNEKFEKIEEHNQILAYDLFLHKALMLSLDMISHFDSEKHSGYYNSYDTFENCCLISKGLFTQNFSDTKALGLMVDLNNLQDFSIFKQMASNYIALSINLNEWTYQGFSIPDHIQYLCFRFSTITYFDEGALLYSNFLEEEGVFPNVRDLTIRYDCPEYCENIENYEKIEKNIIAGLTRKRFPKLLRISLQGFSILERFLECDLLREIPYVEIIPQSMDIQYEPITNWSEGKVHNLVKKHFIENESLIHHLVMHANISRVSGDADYDSIKEYYDLSIGRFVASISHSSFVEYFDKCYE
ncbi:predicted protein [Naegleria gruberi]|uniref:Predicted protein n=1 Tax=Naegleria gruberi TaxID=5762 RepID=D2VWT2_NAEGR|nr:uncharacterized protein NAEGRDRAFT_59433 [Naegleria gruberi]EFC38750.1 predicted protein [Naegleria gruberi]|eukprot:XP_002671494.1 predicted protein [Naegleria gruberi strain NEG-M]